MREGDMIASLYNLPKIELAPNIKIKRAYISDKDKVMEFIATHFQKSWQYEAEYAMMQDVSKCFLAVDDGKIVGFACYDASGKGFFGPTGVDPNRRGEKIGQALLIRTMEAMREYGYGYAIIGWVGSAASFYEKLVGATFIEGGTPDNSVYSEMISM